MIDEEKVTAQRTNKKKAQQIDWSGIGMSLAVTAVQGIVLGLTASVGGKLLSTGAGSARRSGLADGGSVVPMRKSGAA